MLLCQAASVLRSVQRVQLMTMANHLGDQEHCRVTASHQRGTCKSYCIPDIERRVKMDGEQPRLSSARLRSFHIENPRHPDVEPAPDSDLSGRAGTLREGERQSPEAILVSSHGSCLVSMRTLALLRHHPKSTDAIYNLIIRLPCGK